MLIMALEGRQRDVVFLGHSTYIDDPKNKLDKLPIVEMWSRSKSKALSMGGTFGYIISKNGAKKILDNISKVGITNGIDWMMFLPDGMKNYYCLPHIVFSECKSKDSDIQCNSSTMELSLSEKLKVELEYWMRKTNSEGIKLEEEGYLDEGFPVKVVKESNIIFSKNPNKSGISEKILLTKNEGAKSAKNWYSVGGYYFVIPDNLVSKDLILNGKFFGNILRSGAEDIPVVIVTFVVCPNREQQHLFMKNNPSISTANVVSVPLIQTSKVMKLFENATDEVKSPQIMSRMMAYVVVFTEMIKSGKDRCFVYDCLAKIREQPFQYINDSTELVLFEPAGMSFYINKAGMAKILEKFASHGIKKHNLQRI